MEKNVSAMQEEMVALKATVSDLTGRTMGLESRLEDVEVRARRCNFRFVEFPQGAEGLDPETFLEERIRWSIPTANLSP